MAEVIRIGPKVRVADTGEPSAEERGWITWPMTDGERRQFGDRLEAICARYRAMTPGDVDRFLAELAQSPVDVALPPAEEDA